MDNWSFSSRKKYNFKNNLRQNKKENPNLIIVDGDKVRNLYENKIGYDKVSRSKNTLRYINLAKWLLSYDISSVCAVISPFEKDREICRKTLITTLRFI